MLRSSLRRRIARLTRHDRRANHHAQVVPNDALRIINRLNSAGAGLLPVPPTPPNFFDVNGDGFATSNDALQLINFLNSDLGEGESQPRSLARELAPTHSELLTFRTPDLPDRATSSIARKTTLPVRLHPVSPERLFARADSRPPSVKRLPDFNSAAGNARHMDWENLLEMLSRDVKSAHGNPDN